MITEAILYFFVTMLQPIMWLLPTADLSSFEPIRASYVAITSYANLWNSFIPVDTMFWALSMYVSAEIALLVWRFAKWFIGYLRG